MTARWALFESPGYGRAVTMVLDGDFAQPGLPSVLRKAFHSANRGATDLPNWVFHIQGMSGRRYRNFINILIRNILSPVYLEVGSWVGSTACSVIANNPHAVATCIDNSSKFGGPKEIFDENLSRAMRTNGGVAKLIEADFRSVDFSKIGPKANVFFFDGPHTELDQFDGIMMALPALQETFVLVVNDFNWEQVRAGTWRALTELKLKVLCNITVRSNSHGDATHLSFAKFSWHNGYFLAVVTQAGG